MTEQRVMQLLRAVFELDVQEREERIAEERAACLSLGRARALALNPNRLTEDERIHIERCRYCAHLIESFRRHITHPSPLRLLLRPLGMLKAKEAQTVEHHLKKEECQRCLHLIQSSWLKGLAELVQAGQRTVKQVKALVRSAIIGFTPLPQEVGTFTLNKQPPFQWRGQNGDGSLTVVLRETDEGKLVVHVQTPDPQKAGSRVRVEILGKDLFTKEVKLHRLKDEKGCAGRGTFGRFADIASRLGTDCTVVVSPPTGAKDQTGVAGAKGRRSNAQTRRTDQKTGGFSEQ